MKKYIIVGVVAIAVLSGFQVYRELLGPKPAVVSNVRVLSPETAHDMLVKGAKSPAQKAYYETLKAKFPEEYGVFLNDIVMLYRSGPQSDEAAFVLGQQFAAELRRAKAYHLGTAPMEALRGIRATNIALLADMMPQPETCAVFALNGGGALTMEQAKTLDPVLVVAMADTLFLAIAAGRDAPVTHEEATEADFVKVLELWRAEPDVTPELEQAMLGGDVENPLVCEANLNFERFVHASADTTVQNVGVHLIKLGAGI